MNAKRAAVLSVAVLLVAGLFFSTRPQAQEVDEENTPDVTESEIQTYIEIYEAMQADHGLTIDQVLASRDMSLDQFRSLERRIQKDERYVERVRGALLEQAKRRMAEVGSAPAGGRSGMSGP